MKKYYPFLVLLLFLCQHSFAKIGRATDIVFSVVQDMIKCNDIYLNDADVSDKPFKLISFVAQDMDLRSDGREPNLTMFELTGTRQINNALLIWRIITSENVDHFEIERRINNGTYITIAAIHQPVYLNEPQSLNYTDNIYGIGAKKIMYRVKIVSQTNKSKYSNVSVIHQSQLKQQLTIAPNQAKDYVNVGFYSEKEATVEIRVLDGDGKKIYAQKEPVYLGNNTVKLMNLNNYQEGVYTIQVILNGELTSGKLMLLTQ